MRTPFKLLLPCEVFEFQASSVFADELSPLEQLVLRAVAPAETTLDELMDLFGLPDRPMADLVLDLWRRDYVSFTDRGLELTTVVRRLINEEDGLAKLNAGEVRTRSVRAARELVTGRVVDPRLSEGRLQGSRIVPPRLSPATLLEVDRSELRAVAEKEIAREKSVRKQKLLGTNLKFGPTGEPEGVLETLFVAVTADVRIDPSTGDLLLDVRHPTELGVATLRSLSRGLTQLALERPEALCFKQAREAAVAREPDRLEDPEEALEELRRKVDSLRGLDRGLIAHRNQEATQLAARVSHLVVDGRASEEKLAIVEGQEEIAAAVEELIANAERQLVVACPFLSYRTLERLQPLLARALDERRVDIFLLWGIAPTDELDEEIHRLVSDLGRSDRMHIARVSARTHAKVLVSDGRSALVTSHNFLSGSATPLIEVGVRIDGEQRRCSRPALALLKWARSSFPDPVMAQRMQTAPAEFDPEVESVPRALGPAPELPAVLTQESPLDAAVSVARDDLLQQWDSWLSQAEAVMPASGHRTWLVEDEDHRRLLWAALRQANTRLLIASDQLTRDVVDDAFMTALSDALKSRRVRVRMVFRRPHEAPLERLRNLAAKHPALLTLVRADNHAKVLLWDDQAIVTSLNFLSFEGSYRGPERRRVRSEVGLRFKGVSISNRIEAALCRLLPQLGGTSPLPEAGASASPPMPVHQPLDSEFYDSLLALAAEIEPGPDFNRRALELAQNAELEPALWNAPDRLQAASGTTEGLLRAGVGALLAVWPAEQAEGSAGWRRWAAEYGTWAWLDCDCTVPATVRSALGPAPACVGLPPAWLVDLVAAVDEGAVPQRLWLDASPGDDVQLAYAVSAAVALTLARSADHFGADQRVGTLDLPEPLAPWVEALLAFRRKGQELPLSEVRERVAQADAFKEQHRLRRRLISTYDEVARRNFNFQLGTRTWHHLFGRAAQSPFQDDGVDMTRVEGWVSEHEMAALRLAALQDRPDRAAKWLTEHGEEEAALGVLLDRSSVIAAQTGDPLPVRLIHHPIREAVVNSLIGLAQAARAWVDGVVPPPERALAYQLDRARELAERLRPGLPALQEEQRRLSGERSVAAPVLTRLLDTLDPLFRLREVETEEG